MNDIKTIGEQIERLTNERDTARANPTNRVMVLAEGSLAGIPLEVQNGKVVRRDDLLGRPILRAEHVTIKSVSSFIDYANRHKMPKSVIFADESQSAFNLIVDYEDSRGVLNKRHSALMKLEHTTPFDNWSVNVDRRMTQEEFALFLEANAPDIVNPAAAQMIAVAQTLRAKSDVSFESKTNLANGEIVFSYSEEVKGTTENGNAAIPSDFQIGVVVYRGQPDAFKLDCKLRYRIDRGKLQLWYSIPALDRALEQAYLDVKKQITDNVADVQMFDAAI